MKPEILGRLHAFINDLNQSQHRDEYTLRAVLRAVANTYKNGDIEGLENAIQKYKNPPLFSEADKIVNPIEREQAVAKIFVDMGKIIRGIEISDDLAEEEK